MLSFIGSVAGCAKLNGPTVGLEVFQVVSFLQGIGMVDFLRKEFMINMVNIKFLLRFDICVR